MQLADAVVAIAIDAGRHAYFVYHEQMLSWRDIPSDVTHVRIDSSVRTIQADAFLNRSRLRIVILNEELEEIESGAFWGCRLMEEIVIPNNVRRIGWRAFRGCTRLTRVTLGDGLEKIGREAFLNCSSIKHILIPPVVKTIDDTAFKGCTNLTRVKFCDEIEELVSCDAMREWWNQGIGRRSTLRTFSFLVRCNIPARLKSISNISSWQAAIHNMLRTKPYNIGDNDDIYNEDDGFHIVEGIGCNIHEELHRMNAHFDAIDAKLTAYMNLINEAHTFFPDQFHLNNDIVLNILSYL
jgi:hypothetical protein